jgi:hypothetical protein
MSSFKQTQALTDLQRNQEKINREQRNQQIAIENFQAQEAEKNKLNIKLPAAELAEEQIGVATPLREETAGLSNQAQMVAETMLDEPQQPQSRDQQLSREIQEAGTDDPLVQEIMRTQMFDDEGRPFSMNEQQARGLLEEAKELSSIQTTADIPFQYQTKDEFEKEMAEKHLPVTAQSGSVNMLVDLGKQFTMAINNVGKPTFTSSDPDSVKLQDYLVKGGLISPDGTVSLKFGNVLAFQFAENVLNELNKRDEMSMNMLDPEDSFEQSDDLISFFDEVEKGPMAAISKPKAGMRINPLFERSRFGKGILNRALPNQGQVGAATILFGGEGDRADAGSLEMLDGLAYMAMNNLGFIKEVTHNGNTFYDFTDEAILFYDGVREVLDDLTPERSILPSLTPNVTGVGFGLERERGFKQTGNVSVKSVRSDSNEEQEFLNTSGRVAMRVNESSGNTFSNYIHSNIRYNIKNRRVILSRKAFVDQHPTKFCSTHPTAAALGISEKDWDNYKRSARMRAGVTEADAAEQADMIIAMQARLRVKNLMVAEQFKDRSMYMKRFYASANNRFHFRNSAFDPQNSKAVRNLLISAQPVFIDVRDQNTQVMKNFKYIIGRALLDREDFMSVNERTTRAEDMGMNETIRLAEEVIFNPDSPKYSKLIKEARYIRKLSNILDANAFRAQFEMLPDNLKALYADKDDWGLKSQAYIDFINYVETMMPDKDDVELISSYPTTADGKPTSIRMQQLQTMLEVAQEEGDQDQIQIIQQDMRLEGESYFIPIQKPPRKNQFIFQAKATAKHDGKQSGMAIYGLLYGINEMVKRVGLIYEDETNIINEGDIRDYFMTKVTPAIDSILRTDAKKTAFKGVFHRFMDDPNMAKDFAKKLSRAPLMETSYGSYIGFQHETVLELLNDPEFGPAFQEAIEQIKNENPMYTDRDAISDLNLVIATTLTSVLSLDYQHLLKDIGRIFAAMGETPYFITPTGKKSFYGSREMYETNQVVRIPLGDGEFQERNVKATRPSGTKRTSKVPMVYDMEVGKLVRGEPSKFGQETINQLPVLFIQSIDGAVMAKTINFVNQNRKTPLFFIDIHDSLITDARSVHEYHAAYNRIFKELIGPTEKGFKPLESVALPLAETINNFKLRLDDDKRYLVSHDSPKFRALHDQLIELNDVLFNARDNDMSAEMQMLFNLFRTPKTKLNRKDALARLGNLLSNWDVDGAMLTGREIKLLINFLFSYRNIKLRVKNLQSRKDANLMFDTVDYDSIAFKLAKTAYQLN